MERLNGLDVEKSVRDGKGQHCEREGKEAVPHRGLEISAEETGRHAVLNVDSPHHFIPWTTGLAFNDQRHL